MNCHIGKSYALQIKYGYEKEMLIAQGAETVGPYIKKYINRKDLISKRILNEPPVNRK